MPEPQTVSRTSERLSRSTASTSWSRPLFCQSLRRKVVSNWTSSPTLRTLDAASTSILNQCSDSPGGKTVAQLLANMVPAVKLLTATTRTDDRRIMRSSSQRLELLRASHTSLPWHTTEMPFTQLSRANNAATGSKALCASTNRVGTMSCCRSARDSLSMCTWPKAPEFRDRSACTRRHAGLMPTPLSLHNAQYRHLGLLDGVRRSTRRVMRRAVFRRLAKRRRARLE